MKPELPPLDLILTQQEKDRAILHTLELEIKRRKANSDAVFDRTGLLSHEISMEEFEAARRTQRQVFP